MIQVTRLVALTAITLSFSVSWAESWHQVGQETYFSESDDCIEGYTSLLQESANLVERKLAATQRSQTVESSSKHGASRKGRQPPESSIVDYTPLFDHHADFMWIAIGVTIFVIFFWFVCLGPAMRIHSARCHHRDSTTLTWIVNDPESSDYVERRIHDELEEDTFCLATALLVRDIRSLSRGEGLAGLKYMRILYALGVVLLTYFIQISVLWCTKTFVTPLQVEDIRDTYDVYETVMYDNHIYYNVNGKARGIPGYFNASNFELLDDDMQSSVCNIPFSELLFIFLILGVWSVTCIAAIRKSVESFFTSMFFLPTLDSMRDCLIHWEDYYNSSIDFDNEVDSPRGKVVGEKIDTKDISPPILVIVGLTWQVKLLLCVIIHVPEFLTYCILLLLGSRWLVATNDFGNIASNAVALGFVLELKSILFAAVASDRNKRELAHTGCKPPWSKEAVGYGVFFSTVVWLAASVGWVYMYIFHWQDVLPDYHWDVHEVCAPWLLTILDESG